MPSLIIIIHLLEQCFGGEPGPCTIHPMIPIPAIYGALHLLWVTNAKLAKGRIFFRGVFEGNLGLFL